MKQLVLIKQIDICGSKFLNHACIEVDFLTKSSSDDKLHRTSNFFGVKYLDKSP